MNWNASWNKPKPYLPTSALNCANAPMVTGIKVSGAQISNSMGCLSYDDLVGEYVTIEKVICDHRESNNNNNNNKGTKDHVGAKREYSKDKGTMPRCSLKE